MAYPIHVLNIPCNIKLDGIGWNRQRRCFHEEDAAFGRPGSRKSAPASPPSRCYVTFHIEYDLDLKEVTKCLQPNYDGQFHSL